ncbi:EamA family transporter RarD [Mesorhizobium sp. J428]|uniref:EamA family transporter RarD n=1 Tax=Mesorhizobium sp. J428 TaxID=2898440 RepID=UPI002151AB85|nr:EamA family transporter RarD [Mesorhizobium sp. J428]MCR5859084.1 EamA family transporter RarD [Mesorhizobium sp. J428]
MTTVTDTGAGAPPAEPAPSGDTLKGFFFALTAYLLWGFLPLFMKLVAHLPTLEVLAHRVIWSVPIALLLLVWLGRTSDISRALRSPRTMMQAAVAAAFISCNWGIYVWAISVDRVLETALGYYINPLLTVLVGALLLGERMSRAQMVAIGFAVAAVAVLTWDAGGLPWVSLALAGTWAAYAFFKRTLPVGPAQGFLLEVLILLVPALAVAAWFQATGRGHFFEPGGYEAVLFVGCGVVTAVPLIIYATGAKLLTLSTIGIMQHIAPTLIFLMAVFVFHEPFSQVKLFAFALIWIALAMYTWSFLSRRGAAR